VTDFSLSNSAVVGNIASEGGGGITIVIGSGPVTLNGVTINGNTAGTFGGGIFNGGAPLTLTNTTLSGNSAGVSGGGIASAAGSTTLTNVTLSDNSANTSGGGIFNQGGAVQLKSTIVANSPSGGNCAGPITSLGHNLDSGTTCGFNQPGDRNNANPLLGPLQDNGGLTQTHALLPGSPAIDAGDNTGCPSTDQRGVARPGGSACDIGAVEARLPFDLTVFLNQPVVRQGDNLTVGVGAINYGGARKIDAFLAALFPDGVTLAFVINLSPPAFAVTRQDADPRTFVPLFPSIVVPGGFVFRENVLTVSVPGEIPGGTIFCIAVTLPNAFADGLFPPERLLDLACRGFDLL
jgi:hypothetical protein